MLRMQGSLFLLASLILYTMACGDTANDPNTQEFDADSGLVSSDGGTGDAMYSGPPCQQDPLPYDVYRGCIREAYCDFTSRCGIDSRTKQECMDAPPIRRDLTGDSVTAGKTLFNAAAGAACIASYDGYSCQDIPQPCDVYTGTIPDGDICLTSSECLDSRCEKTACAGQCCAGTCGLAPAIGEDCSVERCDVTDRCVDDGQDETCQTGAIGSPCSNNQGCDSGSYCGPVSTCLANKAIGEACDGFQCTHPAQCVAVGSTPGTCELADTVGAACSWLCTKGLRCETRDLPAQYTCVQPAQQGEACSGMNWCALGTQLCVDSICEPYPVLGETCTRYCAGETICSSYIDGTETGICVPLRTAGETCANRNYCASQICIDNICESQVACY